MNGVTQREQLGLMQNLPAWKKNYLDETEQKNGRMNNAGTRQQDELITARIEQTRKNIFFLAEFVSAVYNFDSAKKKSCLKLRA